MTRRPNTQQEKWTAAYWRWLLEAIDDKRYDVALKRAETLEKIKRSKSK